MRCIYMIFKKKNKNIIKVVHYDGLRGFNQDYPCTIEEKDDSFEIKKIKPYGVGGGGMGVCVCDVW